MKENKYGCIVSGDVCLKHDRPLISFGFCEDSPDIIAFIKQIRQQDMEELIKINGYAEYEDRLKMIKEYYKQ
jgi:hypothetical protein